MRIRSTAILRGKAGRAGWTLLAGAALAALTAGPSSAAAPTAPQAGGTYYVDCAAAALGNGSSSAPWNTLAAANAHAFVPGDSLLLARGTTCGGVLTPTGSGTEKAPISIGAYGTGASPVIDAPTDIGTPSAVVIRDESYWNLSDLDIQGGFWRSLWIVNDKAGTDVRGFKVNDVVVHDNGFRAGGDDGYWVSSTGGLVIEPCAASATVSDVTLSHVWAHNTHSVGVQIGHDEKAAYPTSPGSENTPDCHMDTGGAARNTVIGVLADHVTSGDNEESGIWAPGATDLTVQNSTFYANGDGGVPASSTNGKGGLNGEGMWWSYSTNVTVQDNESYGNLWGKGDGGGFDADTGNQGSVIQNNYAHDNDSYCIATFGGDGVLTSNTVIRDNRCVNNGRYQPAQYEGDVFTWTSGQGTSAPSTIADWRAYGNTLTRTDPGPAFRSDSDYDLSSGQPVSFTDNTIRHTDGALLVDALQAGPTLNGNSYTVTGSSPTASFQYGNHVYANATAYRVGSGQDKTSTFAPGSLTPATSLLSQGKPVTASSAQNSAYPASAAVDGDTTTRWASAFSDPQWIDVDLGKTSSIGQVLLDWEAGYATAYQIQTSNDGSTWNTVYSTTTGTGGVQVLNLKGSDRYVRVYCTTRATSYGDSLWEFQVYGAPSPDGSRAQVT